MYQDDDVARAGRASALIDEIARLEHEKITHTVTEQRLETAKRELATLQIQTPVRPRGPGLLAHLVVFSGTAGAAYLGYTLLF